MHAYSQLMLRSSHLIAIPAFLLMGTLPATADGPRRWSLFRTSNFGERRSHAERYPDAGGMCGGVPGPSTALPKLAARSTRTSGGSTAPPTCFVGRHRQSPGRDSKTFVYPPNPSREGQVWGETIDDFGNDLFYEVYRMMTAVDSGWIYYSFPNPATGKKSAKASYVIEIDWDGEPAVIGAGIYSRDWPGTCYADEVSAAVLGADPSEETLREFVRCAAMVVESEGYFAMEALEGDPRWSDGVHYVYVLDMMGNQVMTGHRVRVNGKALHEWGRGGAHANQFGGRDMVDVGGTFGESYVYYRSYNPQTGAYQGKVGFLKRGGGAGGAAAGGGGLLCRAGRRCRGAELFGQLRGGGGGPDAGRHPGIRAVRCRIRGEATG